MNIEFEVVNIFRNRGSPKKQAEEICRFTNFREEDILKAIKKGGDTASDIYENLIKLDKKNGRQM